MVAVDVEEVRGLVEVEVVVVVVDEVVGVKEVAAETLSIIANSSNSPGLLLIAVLQLALHEDLLHTANS